jgi:hypothetical protein
VVTIAIELETYDYHGQELYPLDICIQKFYATDHLALISSRVTTLMSLVMM